MIAETSTINKYLIPKATTIDRNGSVDVLRTLAMMLVVLLHISAQNVVKGIENAAFDSIFWSANLVDSFARVCVPLFVLISGSFLLGREESYATFYKKRTLRILLPLFSWSVIYSIYKLLLQFYVGNDLDIIPIIRSIILGKPFYHLWYLFMLLGLYLITPIINKAIKGLEMKEIKLVAYLLLISGFTINFSNLYYRNNLIFILWFTEYLGYFLLGYVIVKSSRKNSTLGLLTIYSLSSLLIAGLTYYYKSLYFYSYLSPLVIIASLALFKAFSQINVSNNLLARISQLSFGIYLVHAGVLDVFTKLEVTLKLTTGIALVDILVKFLLVLIVSVIIVSFLRKIPRLNKIV